MLTRLRNSKAAHNFGWLVIDRGVRLTFGVVIGSWVARYLGIQDFGLLSYSLALVAIFAALTPLGMEALVVREIILEPKHGGRWVGTMIGFRMAAALAAAVMALGFAIGLRHGDVKAWVMVGTLSGGTLFQSLESGELWFQAHTQMRRLVVPRLILFMAMNVLKVGAVLHGAGVLWFSGLTALEQVVSGGLTWIIVRRSLGPENMVAFRPDLGWKILRHSWPLAISGMCVILYMKLSQLILNGMMGDAKLGIYAAAIRIPEAVAFLPMVLASSLLPSLLKSRTEGHRAYDWALQRYFRINMLLALSIAIPVSIGAPFIIHVLFGHAYADAGPVLRLYVWTLPFLFLGVARGQHLLNELLTHLPLWFSAFGLTINLLSCVYLIPRMGVMGAALATVLSQLASAFLTSFLHPKTRSIGRQQLVAIVTPWKIRLLAGAPDGV